MKRLGYILLLALIAVFGFGFLIVHITPYLYNYHPYSKLQQNEFKADGEDVVIFLDTLFFKKDTIVNHKEFKRVDTSNSVNTPSIGDLGTFGDSAGFWNAIFSGLAMLGVVYTIWYQKKKDSEEDERDRLSKFQEQCFTMIQMLSDIVSQLRIIENNLETISFQNKGIVLSDVWSPNSNQQTDSDILGNSDRGMEITGRACFKYIYDERPYERNIRAHISKYVFGNPDAELEEDLYRDLKKITEGHFDHYFRTVYRILLYIRDTDLGNISEKKKEIVRDSCADFLRAQLSTYELAVLYYNGLDPRFRKTSKAIYEHFSIFDNLNPNILILSTEKDYYNEVQDTKKDGSNFDEKIHYKYKAFTNKSIIHGNPRDRNLFRELRLWLNHHFKNILNTNTTNIESSGLSEKELLVLNIIKNISGCSITFREFSKKSHLKADDLKRIIDGLKKNGFIKIQSAKNGKKYSILKEF